MLQLVLVAALVALAVLAARCFSRAAFGYWERLGVKHDKPIFLFGTNKDKILLRKNIAQVATDTYWKYPNEKVVGFYRSWRPELVIRDPEIIQRILVTDFHNFYPRGFAANGRVETLMQSLFFADGDTWRLLRKRTTPAFSSGKLKAMFPLITERAERLRARTLAFASAGLPIDARDLVARYTTDFIGACGFGIDAESLSDENSSFRKLGVKIFNFTWRDGAVASLKELFPQTFSRLKYMGRYERDVITLVSDTLNLRKHKSSNRNDFIDFLLECKEKGAIVGESIERTRPDGKPQTVTLELSEALIAAQAFVFFAAGFETSSSATSYALHQLAYNPRVQRRAQVELDGVLERHEGRLTYDAVQEMTYLEWCVKEAMRKFPPVGFLRRVCARACSLPGMAHALEPGVAVLVPVHALHNDPQYYPEPDRFLPERFNPNAVNQRNKYVYLPFGGGPRACIGERLALMQSVAGLAAILSQFTVRPTPETRERPEVEPKSGIVQTLRHGLPLYFDVRNPDGP